MECASRFLRARKLKTRAPDADKLALQCQLGRGSSADARSDAEESDQGDVNDVSIMLPPEKMDDDLRLVQEMEMDRHVWSKRLSCLRVFPVNLPLFQPFNFPPLILTNIPHPSPYLDPYSD